MVIERLPLSTLVVSIEIKFNWTIYRNSEGCLLLILILMKINKTNKLHKNEQ